MEATKWLKPSDSASETEMSKRRTERVRAVTIPSLR